MELGKIEIEYRSSVKGVTNPQIRFGEFCLQMPTRKVAQLAEEDLEWIAEAVKAAVYEAATGMPKVFIEHTDGGVKATLNAEAIDLPPLSELS